MKAPRDARLRWMRPCESREHPAQEDGLRDFDGLADFDVERERVE